MLELNKVRGRAEALPEWSGLREALSDPRGLSPGMQTGFHSSPFCVSENRRTMYGRKKK